MWFIIFLWITRIEDGRPSKDYPEQLNIKSIVYCIECTIFMKDNGGLSSLNRGVNYENQRPGQ